MKICPNLGAKKSSAPSATGTNSRRAPNDPGGIEKNKPTARRLLPFLIAAGLCLLASLALAQRSPKKHNQPSEQPPVYDAPKNQEDLSGRFTFARIRFDVGADWAGMPLGDNGPPWSHDYPDAGRHLMQIMAELSKLDVTLGRNEVIYSFGDPELFKYPFAYLCEVGYMFLSEKELAGMREYCLRGGFLLVDDFRLDDWQVFASQIKQAFPEYKLKELDISHPIFNCFFSIKTLDVQPPYGRWTPKFYGLEDSTGRLMMVVNYNNDVSDYWQWSGNPFYPIDTTQEAYKFGVNYIIYALTH